MLPACAELESNGFERPDIATRVYLKGSSEVVLEKPNCTIDIVETKHENLHISVGSVDGRETDPVTGKKVGRIILVPLSLGARLVDPDSRSNSSVEVARLEMMAHMLKALVVGIEQPGVGASTEIKLPFLQAIQPVFDGFDAASWNMVGALREVHPFDKGDHVEFVGFGQSNNHTVRMSENMSWLYGVETDRITWIEPINDQPLGIKELFTLGGRVSDEVAKGKHHFADNDQLYGPEDPESEAEIAELKRTQRLAENMGAVAVGLHPFMPAIERAILDEIETGKDRLRRTRFDIVKSSDSSVSIMGNNMKSARTLRDLGVDEVNVYRVIAAEGQTAQMEMWQSILNVQQLCETVLS